MTLEEIFLEWEKDSEIDITKLDVESLMVSNLHFKYYKLLIVEKMKYSKMESDVSILKKLKSEYYMGTLDSNTITERGYKPFKLKVLKADLPMYLESDEELIQMNLRLSACKEKILFLESIIKTISMRGYQIKTAVDWIKFKNGSL